MKASGTANETKEIAEVKVALIGAAGAEVLRELVAREHQVTAVVRRPDAIDPTRYPGSGGSWATATTWARRRMLSPGPTPW
jgi:cation diffusion facilitator CzcD-associated flavoprotein CzcO